MSSVIALTLEQIKEDRVLQEIIKDTPEAHNFSIDLTTYGGLANTFVYATYAKSELDGLRYKYTFIGRKSVVGERQGVMYVTRILREA